MDLKDILSSNNKSADIQVHKKSSFSHVTKSNTTNYSNKTEIDDLLAQEKQNLYYKSWNKLDNSTKNNLFKEFVVFEKQKHTLNEKESLLLLNLLLTNIKKLNKASEVEYNQDECKIIKVNNLIFDINDKSYSLNIIEKKPKSNISNKSKSRLSKFIK
jgi:hypothetical protein|tara:strand:- start:1290 stop:1763 length:474 start_codon:yes stop_codon:yes gene_type:complete